MRGVGLYYPEKRVVIYRQTNRRCFAAYIRLPGGIKPDLFTCTFSFRCNSQYAGGGVLAHVVAYLYKIGPSIVIIFQRPSPLRATDQFHFRCWNNGAIPDNFLLAQNNCYCHTAVLLTKMPYQIFRCFRYFIISQ